MTVQEELQRLSSSVSGHSGELSVEIVATTSGNAGEVLDRCKDILRVVIDPAISLDAPGEKWKPLLPAWFTDACSPEITRAEAEEILAGPNGFNRYAEMWSLSDFLHWFKPGARQWFWLNGKVQTPDKLVVALQVDGWPFPWGALHFLLKAAGAKSIAEGSDLPTPSDTHGLIQRFKTFFSKNSS
jgi:hypothetical protein